MTKPSPQRLAALAIAAILFIYLITSMFSGGGDELSTNDPGAPTQQQDQQENETDLSSGPLVYILPIKGGINDVTRDIFQKRAAEAVNAGATILVLEMDTPGGLVSSVIDICTTLKEMENVRTIAWVHPMAYSGGVMTAVACDEIVMSNSSAMGASTVIFSSPGGGVAPMGEREIAKFESPVLAGFRDSAKRNGYSEVLCDVMVKTGPAVYRIKNEKNEEVRYIYATDLADYGLAKSDLVKGVKHKTAKSTPDTDLKDKPDTESKEATSSESKDQPASDITSTEWQLEKLILREGEILVMTQDTAIEYGFSKGKINTLSELANYCGTTTDRMVRLEITWSEQLAAWLTSPAIKGILMLGLMLGAYMEFQSPGLGLPGLVAAICLALILGAPLATGLADIWEVVLIVSGVALIAVEVFVIPGFGVAGFSGLVLIFCGLVLTFVQPESGDYWWPRMQQTWDQLKTGFVTVSLSMILSCVGFYYLTKYFGAIPFLNRLMLADVPGQKSITIDHAPDKQYQATGQVAPVRLGQQGEVTMPLHPTGRAEFDSTVVDVVSEGDWIETGTQVVITEIHGNRIVVEEVKS